MGNHIPGVNEAAYEKLSAVEKVFGEVAIAGCGIQGIRNSMEDEHLIEEIPGMEGYILLGVFDGHSGSAAARFAREHMLTCLLENLTFANYRQDTLDGNENILLLQTCLEEVFVKIDDMMRVSDIISREGCTAVVCIITPNHYICANAGDSRCILGRQLPVEDSNGSSKSIDLSIDHKPSLESERDRIIAAGGFIEMDELIARVNGILSVSRGFGDFDMKANSDLPPLQQVVSCFPEVTITERHALDDFVILACDGLWDVSTSDQCTEKVREVVGKYGEDSMILVAHEILDWAMDLNTSDNVTVVVARLPGAIVGDKHLSGGALKAKIVREENKPRVYDMYDNVPKQDATPQFGSIFYGLDDEDGPPAYEVNFE